MTTDPGLTDSPRLTDKRGVTSDPSAPSGETWQPDARDPAPAAWFVATRPGSTEPTRAPIELPLVQLTGNAPASGPPARRGQRGGFPVEFGPLAAHVADPAVTDVFVNGPGKVWVDRGAGPVHAPGELPDEAAVRALAVSLLSLGGRHIDEATPCVDARLHDGIRVHAVLPPISPAGTLISIRLPRVEIWGVDDLDRAGFFAAGTLAVVRAHVAARRNLLISGAGGSGKTTLLGALLGLAAPNERIVAIEDVAELRVAHPQFVSLEARQANIEGAGELGLARLVREALRMRPDRLVLGECRGEELRDLLAALNTGHDGGAGTLHANSLADVPARLEALGALAGLSETAVARQAVSAIDVVLHLEQVDGVRRLAQIGELRVGRHGRLEAVSIDAVPIDAVPVDAVPVDAGPRGSSGL